MPIDVPMSFDDFVGNKQAIGAIKLIISDAVQRDGILPHIGIFGPAGHGKTTLAKIIADSAGRRFVYVNSVAVRRSTLLRGLITHPENMAKGAVILLDECHRLPAAIQDNLLSVLEKPAVLVTSYKDQLIRDNLPDHISFILASTHQGFVRDALLQRLENIELHEYSTEEKQTIAAKYLNKAYGISGANMEVDAILDIGRRSRSGRNVVKTCDNIIRYMKLHKLDKVTVQVVESVYEILGIDINGLTKNDKKLLGYLRAQGTCGLETLEAYLNIPKRDIKDKVEPFLLKRSLMVRHSSGRTITQKGMAALTGEKLNG